VAIYKDRRNLTQQFIQNKSRQNVEDFPKTNSIYKLPPTLVGG
jgi:hypothetical protein